MVIVEIVKQDKTNLLSVDRRLIGMGMQRTSGRRLGGVLRAVDCWQTT